MVPQEPCQVVSDRGRNGPPPSTADRLPPRACSRRAPSCPEPSSTSSGRRRSRSPAAFHFFALGISAGLAAAAAVVLTVVRRTARRRALGADRHGVLVDGRAALHPRADDAGLPRRDERPRGLRGRGDAAGRRRGARAGRDPGAAPAGRRSSRCSCCRPCCSPSSWCWARSAWWTRSSCPACRSRAARRPGSRSSWASCSTARSARARRAPICSRAASPT